MSYLVLDEALENVKSPQTKEYLKEVISSFNNGNYRSAIVVLYSVVIFDMIEKLSTTSEYYNDENAKEILATIEDSKKKNESYSKWENSLIESVKKTNLFNHIEQDKLDHIKKLRNTYAHAYYNDDLKLETPSKETTRALIRDAFEILFFKDAMMINSGMIISILDDIHNYFKRNGTDGIDVYITDKYLKRFTEIEKKSIFKTLWKFVFREDRSPQNNENAKRDTSRQEKRKSNLQVLKQIVSENPKIYLELVEKDTIFYSDIFVKEDSIINIAKNYGEKPKISEITALIEFLSTYYQFYLKFNDATKKIIENECKRNFHYTIMSPYLYANIDDHHKEIKSFRVRLLPKYSSYQDLEENHKLINKQSIKVLYHYYSNKFKIKELVSYLIDYYLSSPQYGSSDVFFEIVYEYFEEFELDDFNKMIDGIEKNVQIYGSINFDAFAKLIKEHYERRFNTSIDTSQLDKTKHFYL